MARRKISTTVYITEAEDARLKALSERTHVPVAVFIRAGIDQGLAKWEAELKAGKALSIHPVETEPKRGAA